jgi:hypothetical protein
MDRQFPKIFIEHPPLVEWLGDRFEVTCESGGTEITLVLTRHAGVRLFGSLRGEILKSEGVDEVPIAERIR